MEDRLNEYQLVKKLIDDVKKECEEKLDSMKGKKNYHEYSKDLMFRYSDILQAEGALERIKDSAQSVENFVDSLQRKLKEEK
jgi:predicted HicB family RNase H-like nuclease